MNKSENPAIIIIVLSDTDSGTSTVLCIPLDGKEVPTDFLQTVRAARESGELWKVMEICDKLTDAFTLESGTKIHGRMADAPFTFDVCNY